jgi:hypothetical protein
MKLRLSAVFVLAAVPALTHAENQAVTTKAGSLGLGVEYTYMVTERLALRGGINGSQAGFSGVESDIAYQFELVWDSLSAGIDFHPRKSPLRLSVGLLSNDSHLDAVSRPAANMVVGGTTYTPEEVGTLSLGAGFGSTAPFAGIGWDWSRGHERFGVSFDLGLVSQGAPSVSLAASGTLLSDPMFQSNLEAERLELEESLEDLDLYPYATLGFVVRF